MLAVEQKVGRHDTRDPRRFRRGNSSSETGGSPETFEVGTKHPERQHVKQDVAEAGWIVQEQVCHQLPDGEVVNDVGWDEAEGMKKPGITSQDGRK